MHRFNRALLATLPTIIACTSLVGLEDLPVPASAAGTGGAASMGAQSPGSGMSAGGTSTGATMSGGASAGGATPEGGAGTDVGGETGSGGAAPDCPAGCPQGAECNAGQCVCPEKQEVCQNECVDLSMDRDHCGSCGKTCPDECSAARCVQRIFKSTTAALGHFMTFADPTIDDYLYFTDRDAWEVVRVPKEGGTPLVLASDQKMPMGIARAGSYVVWGNQGAGVIMRAAADGSSEPVVLATNAGYPDAVEATASHVYWTNSRAETGSLYRVPLSGGTVETVASPLDNPHDLELDATYAYVTVSGGTGGVPGIVRVPLAGGSPTILLEVQPAGPLFLTPQGSITYTGAGGAFVISREPNGPPPQQIVSALPYAPAADASWGYGVFHTDYSSFVSRFSLDGTGEAEPLAEVRDPGVSVNKLYAQSVAVDGTKVYYSDSYGVIRSTSKVP